MGTHKAWMFETIIWALAIWVCSCLLWTQSNYFVIQIFTSRRKHDIRAGLPSLYIDVHTRNSAPNRLLPNDSFIWRHRSSFFIVVSLLLVHSIWNKLSLLIILLSKLLATTIMYICLVTVVVGRHLDALFSPRSSLQLLLKYDLLELLFLLEMASRRAIGLFHL